MIKCAMSGATGRMGKSIIALIASDSWKGKIVLSGAQDTPDNSHLGQDAGTVAGISPAGVLISSSPEESLSGADVVIDFSAPTHTMDLLRYCEKHGIAAVVGTTGFTAEQEKEIDSISRKIPLLLSPNMSLGVNLLFHLSGLVADLLGESYDIEVVEAHHRLKKDSPSGTAVRLKEVLLEHTGRDEANVVYGRKGMVGQRPPREIGVHAIRGGDTIGEHTVFYYGDGERIELTHRASSRNTFASGALKAASFLATRAAGKYSMQDVLHIQ